MPVLRDVAYTPQAVWPAPGKIRWRSLLTAQEGTGVQVFISASFGSGAGGGNRALLNRGME